MKEKGGSKLALEQKSLESFWILGKDFFES